MNFSQTRMRRHVGLMGACALALGGIAAATVGGARAAEAATCAAGTPCVITGSAELSSGVLNGSFPGSLTWSRTLSGANQNVADTTAGDEGFTVDDATATEAGWHVDVSATTFTCTAISTPTPCATTQTLADTGTFFVNGSTTDPTALTAPSQNCTATGDCTVPGTAAGQQPTFPVAVTTAATTPTAVTIYNAVATTGVGSVDIGQTTGNPTATNPVGWWIHVPGTTKPGSYTSTIDLTVISGPM
jgi:hypothetical protein